MWEFNDYLLLGRDNLQQSNVSVSQFNIPFGFFLSCLMSFRVWPDICETMFFNRNSTLPSTSSSTRLIFLYPPTIFSINPSFCTLPSTLCSLPIFHPPLTRQLFCSYKAIYRYVDRCFLFLTMLSWDWSSISRPWSVRRSSLISVLDVWRVSVLIATSLLKIVDCSGVKLSVMNMM